jgi:transcription-repair coupling factor (superfamily II helicase)
VPARVGALLEVMDLRRHLKQAMVLRLRRQATRLVLRFHEGSGIDPDRLIALARKRRELRILPDNEISIPVLRIDLEGIREAVLGLLADLGLGQSASMDSAEKKRQMTPLEA